MNAATAWLLAATHTNELHRANMARMLSIINHYALAPFAPTQTADGWRLGAALSTPPHLDVDALAHWRPDCDVVLIDPATGNSSLADNGSGWIVGDIDPLQSNVTLYTNGLSFARAWAAARVAWIDLNRRANIPGLPLKEPLNHALPGLLLAGPLGSVCSWTPLLDRVRVDVDDPNMVRPVAAALLRAKRAPIVEALAPNVRRAA
jgi:hypothetical protein